MSRRAPVVVAALLAVACVAVAGYLVMQLRAEEGPRVPAGPSTVASSRSTYDRATITACEKARSATEGDEAADRAVFLLEARATQREAAASDEEALRALARKHSTVGGGAVVEDAEATALVFEVRAWCIDHDLGA